MATTIKGEKPGNVIMIGVPCWNGLLSITLTSSLLQLGTPLNVSLSHYMIADRLVDVARNEIVEHAKNIGAKYLFFIDDDVLVPYFALPRLLNLNVMVASGVYYTKFKPPTPVILKKDTPGGYTNWNFGDVITVDYVGMGCCLINMELFDKLEPPYFKYQKGPTDPKEDRASIGEDVWFCKKVAEEASEKIYVDTLVQCKHENWAEKTQYFYHDGAKTGAWIEADGLVRYVPEGKNEMKVLSVSEAVKNVRLCWGFGNGGPEGFKEAGTTDSAELQKKYANIEAITMKNVLEFRSPEEVTALLITCIRLMKPGAEMTLIVPDIMKRLKTLMDTSTAKDLEGIMGFAQGRFQSFYTKAYLKQLSDLLGLKKATIKKQKQNLVLTGTKGE